MPLLIYALILRKYYKKTKLFSYNHQYIKPNNGKVKNIDIIITKFFYKNLDRVIFYSYEAYNKALKNRLLKTEKAYWANNTIDTNEVKKYYNFILPPKSPVTIVFIGRLIRAKRVDKLINF